MHDTRREATSRLSKKVDVLTLAKITGHKDLNMLMIYYDEDMSDVAKRIEREIKHPGVVKVTVIRETRIVEHAY